MADIDKQGIKVSKSKNPPPIPSKPSAGKPEAPPKPNIKCASPKPAPRKPVVPSKPSPSLSAKRKTDKPAVPSKTVHLKKTEAASEASDISTKDVEPDSNPRKAGAKAFLIGELGTQIKNKPGTGSKDQDNNDIPNFSFQWEKKLDSVQCIDNANKNDTEVPPENEETQLDSVEELPKGEKRRKRSSNSGLLAAFKAKFSSSKEENEEKKKKKEKKKSIEKRGSKSKFYVSDGNENDSSVSENGGALEKSDSTFYISGESKESAESVDAKEDTESIETSPEREPEGIETSPKHEPESSKTSPVDEAENVKSSPVLPPKSMKRKSYHEQLVEKGLTPVEIETDTKPKPARRKKRVLNVDNTSDFSSTESLLASDHSDSSKGAQCKADESQGGLGDKDTKDSNNKDKEIDKTDDKTTNDDDLEKSEQSDQVRDIKRKEKKRNIWNKDALKSFTTEDMDIFHPTKSVDMGEDDDDDETATSKRRSKEGNDTAPVTRRGRDPLRKIKAERRRSQSVGASPARRTMFGVSLKPVAKPKVLERPHQKPPPPPGGRSRQLPPPPPPPTKRLVKQSPGASSTESGATSGAASPSPGAVSPAKGATGAESGATSGATSPSPGARSPATGTESGAEGVREGATSPQAGASTDSNAADDNVTKKADDNSKTVKQDGAEGTSETKKDLSVPSAPLRKHRNKPSTLALKLDSKHKEPEESHEPKLEQEENIYDNNFDTGIPIEDNDSPKSPEDKYEEIEFPGASKQEQISHSEESQADEEAMKTSSHKPETFPRKVPVAKEDTVAKGDTVADRDESSTVEYSNVLAVPGQGLSTEAPKVERGSRAKVSRKVSRKVSLKLTRKLTQRVKERNLDQSIVKQFLREESLDVVDVDLDDAVSQEEPVEFSDTDSEFDDDSDESDIEWEQELMAKLDKKLTETQEKEAKEEQSPPEVKLRKIAQELLDTENAYVERLHLVDQVFHFRVVLENRQHHMFPNEVLPQMFSNIKSIYQFHHDFLLPKLQARMDKWDEDPRIGDVMKDFAPFLKLYSEYVKNYGNAMTVIDMWQVKCPRFFSIMADIHKTPECGLLTLQHHMLEPIQRVPRYELLLKTYLKHLTEDSADYVDTQAALKLVSTAAIHNNEAMSKSDKFRKMLEINESLGGGIDLTSPTRELVKEGRIIKVSPRNGAQQERYLYLFNDMLLVCQSVASLTLKTQYRVRNKMDIEGMQVLEGDNLELPNTFYVKSKTKTIEVHFTTFEEKVEWQVTLWSTIKDYVKKQQSRNIALSASASFQEEDLGNQAPKWIKDQETTMCMICSLSFTTFRRRHHCRACGIVVCGKCSTHKAHLAYNDSQSKSRVCDKCHIDLHEKGEIISSPTLISSNSINGGPQRKRGILQVKATEKGLISGYLHMSLDKKTWTKRYFVVHDDFVMYSYKAHQDVVAMTSLPLPGHIVSEADDKDALDRSMVFKLTHPQQKTYLFQTDNDQSVMKRWLYIMQCVTNAEKPDDISRATSSTNMALPPVLPSNPPSPSPQ